MNYVFHLRSKRAVVIRFVDPHSHSGTFFIPILVRFGSLVLKEAKCFFSLSNETGVKGYTSCWDGECYKYNTECI